ncbi:hypothetical protein NMY22_g11203 [Coprinellus aureogranulatus]|nr:hypothetical protein NMY22_g11203 [Coprinellus aureogranulatus]
MQLEKPNDIIKPKALFPAPLWAPPLSIKLEPDHLTRVSDEQLHAYIDNPSTLIGKALAGGWDHRRGEFRFMAKIWAVIDTDEGEQYMCLLVPGYEQCNGAKVEPVRALAWKRRYTRFAVHPDRPGSSPRVIVFGRPSRPQTQTAMSIGGSQGDKALNAFLHTPTLSAGRGPRDPVTVFHRKPEGYEWLREAYTAATASWKQPVIEDNAEAVDAEIQKLYAIKNSWDDDPNPNKKEKVIRMLTSSNYAYLLQKRASMLPGDLRFEYLRRYEDEYTVELPYDIPAERLQDAEISGNARLLTVKERKKIAEHPETALGKVFRIEGRYRRGEDEVFKVNGVLLLVEDKMVYLTYPESGKVAGGTTSRSGKRNGILLSRRMSIDFERMRS